MIFLVPEVVMRRVPVESSCVLSVGYSVELRELEVEFSHLGIYAYDGVPPEVHAALLAAESKGVFVNAVVKAYPFRRMPLGTA